jgi:hypothetical protein
MVRGARNLEGGSAGSVKAYARYQKTTATSSSIRRARRDKPGTLGVVQLEYRLGNAERYGPGVEKTKL